MAAPCLQFRLVRLPAEKLDQALHCAKYVEVAKSLAGYPYAETEAYAAMLAAAPRYEPQGEAVEAAMDASANYWDEPEHMQQCTVCNGSGAIPCGEDSQDYCPNCSGGTIHAGTEEGAMRAALTAAYPELLARIEALDSEVTRWNGLYEKLWLNMSEVQRVNALAEIERLRKGVV